MQFCVLTDPTAFVERTANLLDDRVEHNLIIWLASDAARAPELFTGLRMFIVDDDEHDERDAVAAALITPPHNLVLGAASGAEAMDALISGVRNDNTAIPGVVGIRPSVDAFVEGWNAATGDLVHPEIAQGVFSLESVNVVPAAPGTARLAVAKDYDTVLRWYMAFLAEALPRDPADRDDYGARVRNLLEDGNVSGVWLWEIGGKPVAMTSHSGSTDSVIRIRAVYTPPEWRGNGYATSLVAHQSQWALDSGYRFCTLFTDLSNPTSNAIYQRIGYAQIAESAQYRFDAESSADQPS